MSTIMEILGTIAEAAVEVITAKNANFSTEELETLLKAESIIRNASESKKTTTSSYTYEKPVVDIRTKIEKEMKLEIAFKENDFFVYHDHVKGFTYFFNANCYSRAVWRDDKMYIFTVHRKCIKEIMKDLEKEDPIAGWAVILNPVGLSIITYGSYYEESYKVCDEEIMKIAKSVM